MEESGRGERWWRVVVESSGRRRVFVWLELPVRQLQSAKTDEKNWWGSEVLNKSTDRVRQGPANAVTCEVDITKPKGPRVQRNQRGALN